MRQPIHSSRRLSLFVSFPNHGKLLPALVRHYRIISHPKATGPVKDAFLSSPYIFAIHPSAAVAKSPNPSRADPFESGFLSSHFPITKICYPPWCDVAESSVTPRVAWSTATLRRRFILSSFPSTNIICYPRHCRIINTLQDRVVFVGL